MTMKVLPVILIFTPETFLVVPGKSLTSPHSGIRHKVRTTEVFP